jgi:antitoxin PrlF
MAILGKITAKGQTTVPREVREALAIEPGDRIEWEITSDGRVEVRRVSPLDMAYLQALETTLSEWTSREDEEAYGDL